MNFQQDESQPITSADILEAARAIGVLNSSARSAPRILATLCQAGASPREVAHVIGQEPTLTARVLRIANSAYYGVSRAIATIDRAVVVLGLDAVRGIAAAACLDRSIMRSGDATPIDTGDLLRHSVATAAAAEALARHGHRALAPEAFIGGLLHDLGVTVQMRLDPQGLANLVNVARAGSYADMRTTEARHLRIGHEHCAAVLFEAWNLPAALVGAVRHHHDPTTAPPEQRPLAALVHLGEYLSLTNGMGFGAEWTTDEPSANALEDLKISADQLAEVSAALPRLVAHLQGALAD